MIQSLSVLALSLSMRSQLYLTPGRGDVPFADSIIVVDIDVMNGTIKFRMFRRHSLRLLADELASSSTLQYEVSSFAALTTLYESSNRF